jgi:hypothetical protein
MPTDHVRPTVADTTLIAAIEGSMRICERASEGVATPAAILWPDPERQWLPLIPQLRASLPQIYSLGDFDAERRTGPAIWLRCVVDRTVDVAPPVGVCPIIYLPGVSRQELRAGVDCPPRLQPLIELQYRGTTWHQKNGREWSVEAFVTVVLELDLALDARTREAMLRALPRLADVEVSGLRGRRLDADDFDGLAVGDSVRDLLRWMSNPLSFRASLDDAQWASFCGLTRSTFQFTPEDTDVAEAATLLANGGGKWDQVWSRFCEAPKLYPGVVSALRKADHSLLTSERNPAHNETRENDLRKSLTDFLARPHAEACAQVLALAKEHEQRRASVWAISGAAPIAAALEPLSRLASLASKTTSAATAETAATEYADHGWRCDRALLDALSAPAPPADHDLVARVAKALYEPWADASARRFQELMSERKRVDEVRDAPGDDGTCILFVDGLRFDVGVMLQDKLESRGLIAQRKHRITPLPTVTATGKPVTAPLYGAFKGSDGGADFNPVFADSGDPVIAPKLRDAMRHSGIAVLDAAELSGPESESSIGWLEVGQLDEKGHNLGIEMVRHVDEELERIVEQVSRLTELGWRVKIVTDHGWLLLPGGLPKHQLPASLTETKWSRCATVKPGTRAEMRTFPWHWDPWLSIVSPPGIHAFKSGSEYAHGGISLQECVVPEIVVRRSMPSIVASIERVEWRGLRCRIVVKSASAGLRADVRTNRKEQTTSVANMIKGVNDSRVDLLVDDKHEGHAAFVVLIDGDGNVLDHKPTTIGGES